MNNVSFGVFLVSKLKGANLAEWDMSPNTFDFEIKHQEVELQSTRLKELFEEYYRTRSSSFSIGADLIGNVVLEHGKYLVNISNQNRFQTIKGTLLLMEPALKH